MSKAKVKNPSHEKLESIMNDTGLPYFLMAVSHLMDVGYNNMTEENVKETVESIKAEPENPRAIMTKEFKVFIVETAYKISQAANPLDLAKYASKHIA